MTPPAAAAKEWFRPVVVVGQDITGSCEFKDLVAWFGTVKPVFRRIK